MKSESKVQTYCLMILSAVAVTMALVYTKSILVPFVLSFFLYAVAHPAVSFLQLKLRLPRVLSVAVTFMVFVLCISLLVYFIAGSVENFVSGADAYRDRLLAMVDWGAGVAERFGYSLDLEDVKEDLRNLPIFNYAKTLTGRAFSVFGNLFLVLIFFLFLILGESKTESRFLKEIQNKISRYISTKFLTSTATGVLSGLILWIADSEMVFLFAAVTILLNFIPSVGSLIAVALPVPVLLLQHGIGWQFGVGLGGCAVIQMIIGNVLEPKFMGETMDLHPVTILIFLMFWGLVWGIPGMFLAVPITAIIKIVLSRLEQTQGVSELLAGRV